MPGRDVDHAGQTPDGAGGVLEALAQPGRGPGLTQHQRALGRVRAPPGAFGTRGAPQLEAFATARDGHDRGQLCGACLDLDLAEGGEIGEAHRLAADLLLAPGSRERHRHVPAVASLEAGSRGERLALHRAARDRLGPGAEEGEAHERSTSPSGS